MKHFQRYFRNSWNHTAEIRSDTSCCWQKCCNFDKPTRDNALGVSSKLRQIVAKFAYSLLPQIKCGCFDLSQTFLWLKKPSRDTLEDYRILIYVISMEFLSLRPRRSSSRNVRQRRRARRNVCHSQATATTTILLKLVVEWRRLPRFPAKLTLVHARAPLTIWDYLVLVVVLVLESKKRSLVSQNMISSSEPSVNQTLD